MNEKNLLASLAVFRELYDKETDIYNIIASFVNDLILQDKTISFTISEISKSFNNKYEFNIPSSVIKTSLKRLDYLTKSGNSYIVNINQLNNTDVIDNKKLIENSHNEIFNKLTEYVEDKKKLKLSENEINKLHHNFCNYLLDENNGDDYLEFISSFIISHQNDNDIQKKINVIREGVILYSGIKYTNDSYNYNDFGNWRHELNIFLDTEIIFHLQGYNGEVYKEIAEDFLKFTKEINSKSKKNKLIKLYYFPEVKNEIDKFFHKAKFILEGKVNLNPKVTAMVEILNGCSTNSDLQNKKSDLYTFLYRNGIEEFTKNIDVTDSQNREFNIISQDVITEVNSYLGIDNCENLLDLFNKISILRRNNNEENFENIRYILLSGNNKTLSAAFNTSVYERFRVPLATNLNFIINRFWFKLNKGFSQKDFPSSFSILTKSQIVLSKVLNDNIGEKFDDLELKYNKGEITRDQAVNRLKDLRVSTKKPEEIKQEITDEVLDFITVDSLEDYIEKQNHFKAKAKDYEFVSKELKNETNKSIVLKEQLLQSKKARINEKQLIIDDFDLKYNEAKQFANTSVTKLRILIFVFILLFYGIILGLIFYKGWDTMEKYTYIIGVPLTIFLLGTIIFQKQIKLENILNSIKTSITNKRIKRISKYSLNEIENLKSEINNLETEIEEIK
ncbi:hypothetical protein [Neptunitalea lumnitzerae]|uniref:Uncharacterized protein n=1 Tax=Neptunitalea lumnitzerae TaxID=2965509 RepID=A0ABQ5MF23_9FLAO|nr:hypothetical protein [Neptunitalea sp. Y10]GLB47995.1 hypothetical protein Y10_03630 [Neptunitalea sp. Y10]